MILMDVPSANVCLNRKTLHQYDVMNLLHAECFVNMASRKIAIAVKYVSAMTHQLVLQFDVVCSVTMDTN